MKLLPCPFCGCEAKLNYDYGDYNRYEVWCTNDDCNAMMVDLQDNIDALIERWNTRKEFNCPRSSKVKHEIQIVDFTDEWEDLFWYAFRHTPYSDNYPYLGCEIDKTDERWFNLLKEVSNGSQEFIVSAFVGGSMEYLVVQYFEDSYEYFIVRWSNESNLGM